MIKRQKIKDPIIEILKKEFEMKKKKNPAFSLRSFSLRLGIDPSNLSKIFNGQLVPQEKLKKRLAAKLGIGEKEFSSLADSSYSSFDLNVFNLISDWYHFAILELLKTANAQSNEKWIAEKLNLPRKEIQNALSRLVACSLLKIENGKYLNTIESSSSILNTVTSQAHRNQQKQILEKAMTALDEVPIDFRSQSSMIMAIDRSKLAEAKEMIKNFRRSLEKLMGEGPDLNDVYQLSVSLFPITINHKENSL